MTIEFETSDFDELSESQQNWGLHYRPLEKGAFHARLRVRQSDAVQMDLESWSKAIEIAGTTPEDSLAVVFQIEPCSDHLSLGREVCSASIECYGPGKEIHTVTRCQVALGSMLISRNQLLQQGQALADCDLSSLLDSHTIIRPESSALHGLRNFYNIFMHSPNIRGATELHAPAEPWVTSESIEQFIKVLSTQSVTPIRPKRRYSIARAAREFMLERLNEPPTLAEVCASLNVSHRTLHYVFQEVFGISPSYYLKIQRLVATRNALRHPQPGDTVTSVMTEFGFFDPGYFAKYYKAMFGEFPSETLRHV